MPALLSGLVIARNEAHQIGECLASLAGLPVVVIDHHSTDDTAARARAAGASVIEADGTLSELRALGTRAATTPWILCLDADERLPAGALDRVLAELAKSGPAAAYRVPIHTYLGGRRLRFGGYGAARIRLYRADAVSWPAASVHERPVVQGRVERLPMALAIRHLSYRDGAHVREKTRRYAAWAALDLQRAGVFPSVSAGWVRALWRGLRFGLIRGGLMGPMGWRLAALQAAGVWWRVFWARRGVPAGAACPPSNPDLRVDRGI